MIRLETKYTGAACSENEIQSAITRHADTFAAVCQGEMAFAESLGWHDPGKWAPERVISWLLALAEKIRKEAQAVVLIGVGGSNNAARAVIKALQGPKGPEFIYAGNSTSAYAMEKAVASCRDRSVYVIDIAKNFETLEPGIAFRVMRDYLRNRYGEAYSQRIVVIGTRGSRLERLCWENSYCFVEFPEDIGGRYTALSSVGLLPMAVAGIDIQAMVQGAEDMRKQLLETPAGENPAFRYAAVRNLLYGKGYRLEMMASFEPQLRWFYKWWIQLFAESEGKEGKGLYPVASEYSEDLHSVGQYVQEGSRDLFETFLWVENNAWSCQIPADDISDGFSYVSGMDFQNVNRAAYIATRDAHSAHVPCLELTVAALDAYHFGQLFYFFAFSCYLSGRILGINPFNQPGVEAYKQRMFAALGK